MGKQKGRHNIKKLSKEKLEKLELRRQGDK